MTTPPNRPTLHQQHAAARAFAARRARTLAAIGDFMDAHPASSWTEPDIRYILALLLDLILQDRQP